ncbi:hypothetical protein COCCADRAFT_40236 [Bipolaris zeicola 26-R-13]|uniref:Uncharacterized protein n=1 Tax=Cochliobolus carbonum (strain 26-R-13) TaxID=930089 RepID=W6Y2T8_COCC2|nr:uncharacterized protein COCCADRAFT_40236 [Bipolaris zeicola 26-R-13]EUC29374.1 hypothetical protein COCCADRAFT_40236 [Bipolaris zeicola 26-R-13]
MRIHVGTCWYHFALSVVRPQTCLNGATGVGKMDHNENQAGTKEKLSRDTAKISSTASAIGSLAALQSLEHAITLDRSKLYRPKVTAVKGRACGPAALSVFAIRVKQYSFYS